MRLSRWWADRWVMIVALLVLGYLFLPIAVVAVMSFNRPSSRLSYDFHEFTLDNWLQPCATSEMCDAVVRSAQIGFLATVGATVIGTLMAFALVRHRFRGRSGDQPADLPADGDPRAGDGLLAARPVHLRRACRQGFWTILIAHIMFCVSFVVVTVKARLAGMDRRLEQAAMDLYANEWQTFWRITFPLVFPGILAAALLALLAVVSTTSS